ncbi:MAG: hypothetical protein GY724_05950 [Actinomycetia bacterium]|nr:hypothetical protein [Actinomycetes bacterium]MCP5031373.1 hypothetical protein [Actinomycetes bacterium]
MTGATFSATTDNSSNSLAAAEWFGPILFLHNNPTPPVGDTASQDLLPLDSVQPTAATLFNYDTDRDSFPGRFVDKGSGLGETDPVKFQRWSHVPATDLVLNGQAKITIWSVVKNFQTGKESGIVVGLYDCTTAGASCVLLGSGSEQQPSWPSSWSDAEIDLGVINYTITTSRSLVVKVALVATAGESLWFAYDTTTYQSRLFLTE